MAVSIPDYSLYGEPEDRQFTERLHIETVPDRSAVHNWKISPHRHHGLYQFFWIESGGGQLELEDTAHIIRPPLAILVPPLVVHGFKFAPGTDGFVASFPIATLDEVLAPQLRASLDRALVLPQQELPSAVVSPRHLFADAHNEYSGNLPGRSEALCAHAALLGVWFLRATPSVNKLGIEGTQMRAVLLRRFMDVIERRFAEQPSVSVMAKELGVSAPYLTRACRELLGRPALTLVHERIILEAKRCLAFTSMPVSQVAYTLGFADPAYFSRFFRDRVGVNPSIYRATFTKTVGSDLSSQASQSRH